MQIHDLPILPVSFLDVRISAKYLSQIDARLFQGAGEAAGAAAVHSENNEGRLMLPRVKHD